MPTGPAFGRPDDKLRDTHHVLASPCQRARMTDYRRNFIAGGGFLFAANLAKGDGFREGLNPSYAL